MAACTDPVFMNAALQSLCGILTAAMLAALCEVLPAGGLVLMVAVAVLALTAAVGGTRLPLGLKVFATASLFYFGYAMCLIGRTMEPRLTTSTVGMALYYFGLFAVVPTLSLLRLWRQRVAVALVIVVLPLSLFAAAVVAGVEEHLFIQKYRDTGVGPTPRWTVSNHWLSYDRVAGKLHGSD
jgi:O-antigen ligase